MQTLPDFADLHAALIRAGEGQRSDQTLSQQPGRLEAVLADAKRRAVSALRGLLVYSPNAPRVSVSSPRGWAGAVSGGLSWLSVLRALHCFSLGGREDVFFSFWRCGEEGQPEKAADCEEEGAGLRLREQLYIFETHMEASLRAVKEFER